MPFHLSTTSDMLYLLPSMYFEPSFVYDTDAKQTLHHLHRNVYYALIFLQLRQTVDHRRDINDPMQEPKQDLP